MSAEQLPQLASEQTISAAAVPVETHKYIAPVAPYSNAELQSVDAYMNAHAAEYTVKRSLWHTVGRAAVVVTVMTTGLAGVQAVSSSNTAAHDTARSTAELYPDKPLLHDAEISIPPSDATVNVVTPQSRNPHLVTQQCSDIVQGVALHTSGERSDQEVFSLELAKGSFNLWAHG